MAPATVVHKPLNDYGHVQRSGHRHRILGARTIAEVDGVSLGENDVRLEQQGWQD
jgi:hypothetical protein